MLCFSYVEGRREYGTKRQKKINFLPLGTMYQIRLFRDFTFCDISSLEFECEFENFSTYGGGLDGTKQTNFNYLDYIESLINCSCCIRDMDIDN